MANEITANTTLTLVNGGVKASRPTSVKVTQSSPLYDGGVQTVGTSYELIAIKADVATPGFAVFINNDATNYVEIGVVVSATFYPVAKLLAGEAAQFRIGSTALYAKANTAAVGMEFLILAN